MPSPPPPASGGSSASGSPLRALHGGEPQPERGVAGAGRRRPAARRGRAAARVGPRGVDDRGVGQHPARRDVAVGRVVVAGVARARGRPPAGGGCAAGGCRTYAATDRRAAGAAGPAGPPRTPARPTRACRPRPARSASTSRSVDQQLDVERGVGEPVVRQRPGGPVGGRVALLQPDAQVLLDHRAQRDPLLAEQPPGQFGVEQPAGTQPDLGQAGQVLVGGVQDPLGVGRAPR